MLFQPQPVTPVIIIKVVPPPTPEVSVGNIIIDALGLTGFIAIGAIVVGILFGIGLILFKRWREQRSPDTGTTGTRLDLSSH